MIALALFVLEFVVLAVIYAAMGFTPLGFAVGSAVAIGIAVGSVALVRVAGND